MRLSVVAMVICAGILIAAGPALADDLNPPPWRGQPGTTHGVWLFDTPDPNPLPEPNSVYPWGLPTTQVTPGLFQQWMPTWGGRDGVWPLSGEIVVEIPNQPLPNPYKDIWVQLTWAQQAPNTAPAVSEILLGVPATLVAEKALPDGWFHTTYQIRLVPNPALEKILITGAVNVDQMVIDTICVPEPATLGLLLLSGFALLRRRSA